MDYVRAPLAIESDDQERPLSSVVGLADIHHHWTGLEHYQYGGKEIPGYRPGQDDCELP